MKLCDLCAQPMDNGFYAIIDDNDENGKPIELEVCELCFDDLAADGDGGDDADNTDEPF